jgi:hypothetical protein
LEEYLLKQNVLRLDVSVNDVIIVHEIDGVRYLSGDASHFIFGELLFLLEVSVEVASEAVFEHEVKVFLVVEEGVELSDVGVVQKALNFYFSNELSDVTHVVCEEAFLDFLEGTDEVGKLVPGQIDSSELSFLNIFDHLEVFDAQFTF